jgi:hypothetical protein
MPERGVELCRGCVLAQQQSPSALHRAGGDDGGDVDAGISRAGVGASYRGAKQSLRNQCRGARPADEPGDVAAACVAYGVEQLIVEVLESGDDHVGWVAPIEI